MAKHNFIDKVKQGVSVQEVEDFARKHTTEVFTAFAVLIASVSTIFDFFTGPRLAIAFIAIGLILAIFFPAPVERGLKQLYSFTGKQEKATQFVLGGVKILVALFIPFVLFGVFGLLTGTSYHYYIRHAHLMNEHKAPKPHRTTSGEEHD